MLNVCLSVTIILKDSGVTFLPDSLCLYVCALCGYFHATFILTERAQTLHPCWSYCKWQNQSIYHNPPTILAASPPFLLPLVELLPAQSSPVHCKHSRVFLWCWLLLVLIYSHPTISHSPYAALTACSCTFLLLHWHNTCVCLSQYAGLQAYDFK